MSTRRLWLSGSLVGLLRTVTAGRSNRSGPGPPKRSATPALGSALFQWQREGPVSYCCCDMTGVQMVDEQEVPGDIRRALETWDLYGVFAALPDEEQAQFIAWIDQSGDVRHRQHRIDLLTMVLKNRP